MPRVLFVLAVLAGTAAAQPTPGQWVRLTLNDGRTVDGQITGFDSVTYFIQTQQGYFSIMRANVTAITPLGAPAPPPAPTHVVAAPPQPAASVTVAAPTTAKEARKEKEAREGKQVGGIMFGVSYLITASVAASAVSKGDGYAKLAFIPVAGPMIWSCSGNNDDMCLADGWDWLALFDGAVQFLGGVALIVGTVESKQLQRSKVTFVSGRDYSGVSVIGSF